MAHADLHLGDSCDGTADSHGVPFACVRRVRIAAGTPLRRAFFDPAHGGNPILYQHLFWFFGHPEVYVMILPYFGVIAEVIAVFSRKPVFGYVGMVLSAFAIAGLSMGVWAHHMFTTGVVANGFFSGMSFLIAVPTGVKFWNWIGTMWGGKLEMSTAMLFAVGFLFNFLIGGITGRHDRLAAHRLPRRRQLLHRRALPLHAGRRIDVRRLFAAIYFWFPKMFGLKLNETMGKINFWTMFVGFNADVLSDVFHGHRRHAAPRIHLSAPIGDLTWLNRTCFDRRGHHGHLGDPVFVATSSSRSWRTRWSATIPWDAGIRSSGPPIRRRRSSTFSLPPIRSERPVWDLHHPELCEQSDENSSSGFFVRLGRLRRLICGGLLVFLARLRRHAAARLYVLRLGICRRIRVSRGNERRRSPATIRSVQHKEAAGEDIGIVTKESAWPVLLAFSILWMLVGLLWSDFMLFTGLAAMLLCLWRSVRKARGSGTSAYVTEEGPRTSRSRDNMLLLGIETSCDDTATVVVRRRPARARPASRPIRTRFTQNTAASFPRSRAGST